MKHFKTTDIALCTLLTTYGYEIDSIDKTNNPSKAEFLIKRDEGLDDLIQAYFSRRLQVEPMAFFNNLKVIKTRIYHS